MMPDFRRFTCHYCGGPTASQPHTVVSGVYPSCCLGCIDRWEPVQLSELSKEELATLIALEGAPLGSA